MELLFLNSNKSFFDNILINSNSTKIKFKMTSSFSFIIFDIILKRFIDKISFSINSLCVIILKSFMMVIYPLYFLIFSKYISLLSFMYNNKSFINSKSILLGDILIK